MDQYRQLINNLETLKLRNIIENLKTHADKVNSQSESFSEALLELTNKELAFQNEQENERRLTRAHFPIVKRLTEFNFDFQPGLNRQLISELATMSFLERHENVVFIGSPGVGKTHLAISLGVIACEQGIRVLFINCHDLLLKLRAAKEKGHLERVMRRYQRYDLLIIDEVGYLPIESYDSNLFFQLINGRYELRSTILTTNLPLSAWGTSFGNPAAAEATLDRLVHHAHVFKIKGKSYRLAETAQS